MNMMLKIGLAGITGVFLALLLRKEKGEFAMLIAVAAATLIFGYVLVRVRAITDFLEDLAGRLPIEKTYLTALLKMLGITYIADFATSICREAGYGSVGSQMELFAKLSIIALSIPELTYLIQVMEQFL
ncbi:MAG: stage III sporulation AC/AD family protein [Agathobacter sp.]|nr:stage III sporulation AC/AD family protein [Agathobacter sp.]